MTVVDKRGGVKNCLKFVDIINGQPLIGYYILILIIYLLHYLNMMYFLVVIEL